jgi:PKD repeat protein
MRFSAFTCVFVLFFFGVMGQSPSDFPGLELWLRADSAVDLNVNQVSTWFDLSPNENHLTQDINNYRPTLTPDALNGHRAIVFDGSNDRLLFNEIADARTIFWVLREPETPAVGFGPLLGHETTFPFFRGPEGKIWHPTFTNQGIRDGTTRMNFVEVNGVENEVNAGAQILSLSTTTDQLCSKFGQDRTINNFWQGELFELIVFSSVLSEEEIEIIENHLANHYAPAPPEFLDVTVENSVCPIDFEAPVGFESYLWSNGSEEQNTSFQGEGFVWLETSDLFGRSRRDSAYIDFPGNLQAPNDTTLCPEAVFSWETQLSLVDFSITWSSGGTSNTFNTAFADTVFCVVNDNFGCTYESDSTVVSRSAVDQDVFILGDGDQCVGNTLTLETIDYQLQNILWQDEFPGESFELSESGTFWFEASDELGCLARDTVDVNIVGTAPEINIVYDLPICAESEITFEAEVSGGGSIESFAWLLDGNILANESTFNYTFTELGEHQLELIVSTTAGCSSAIEALIEVQGIPEENSIISGVSCEGNPGTWALISDFDSSEFSEILWLVDGETYSGIQINPLLQTSGFLPVDVSLTTLAGCEVSFQNFIEVLPQAEVDFESEGFCFGDLSSFTPNIDMPAGQTTSSLQWSFGDGGASAQTNALHFYPNPGTYEVSLQVLSDASCQSEFSQTLTIFDLPNIDVPPITGCADELLTLPNFSGQANDPISSWEWEISELGSFEEASPQVSFPNSGYFNVNLSVESENACIASSSNVITIYPSPLVDFTFTPEIGLPPIEIQFTNTSEAGLSFEWDFGNEVSSDETSPSVIFEDEGTTEVSLTGTSSLNCSNTQSYTIELIEPISDLVIEFLGLDETPFGYQINALVVNNGNYRSTQRSMSIQNGTSPAFIQLDSQVLDPGESKVFIFDLLASGVTSQAPYICVEVQEVEALSPELHPDNNRTCISETNTLRLLDPYPNPSSDRVTFRFISPSEGSASLKIYNSQGELVFESEEFAIVSGFQEQSLDVSSYPQGLYLYELELLNSLEKGQISVVR